jgi:nucleotide-binding universal stress UspA family protein
MIEPPYRTVAVASTFSPRFLQVLAEAKRIRDRLCREMHLIFVGARDEETTRRFTSALRELELPENSPIHYHEGDPAVAILEAARANEIDLVVAGALEKEAVLRQFLGNVARRLVREATCSVMLFTKPAHPPEPFSRIVLLAQYSDHGRAALHKALRLAALEQCEKLYVIRLYTTFDGARAKARTGGVPEIDQEGARTLEEEEAALEHFIDSAGATEVPIEARCIRGNTGYAVLDFVQSVEATMLVVPDPPNSVGLPVQIEWVTDVIPCNLWVIR